jgi:hypothetical protein
MYLGTILFRNLLIIHIVKTVKQYFGGLIKVKKLKDFDKVSRIRWILMIQVPTGIFSAHGFWSTYQKSIT